MYKILAIDGGGCHGYADLMIIKRLLKKFPRFLDDVDLIAGTSIGGIIALGLASGHKLEDVDKNFIKGLPIAFNTNPARLLAFYAGLCSKYDNSKFKVFLRNLHGYNKLGDLQKKVVIPTFCMDDGATTNRRWRAKIFHNFAGLDSDEEAKVVDVAMATSAAPVFFPVYNKYVDGSMTANNPVLCAVTQTQDPRNLDTLPDIKDIVVLSLGTITNVYVTKRNVDWGHFFWAKHIFNMIGQRDTLVINYMSDKLLGDRYCRVEPVINSMMDDLLTLPAITAAGYNESLDNVYKWLYNYWV